MLRKQKEKGEGTWPLPESRRNYEDSIRLLGAQSMADGQSFRPNST